MNLKVEEEKIKKENEETVKIAYATNKGYESFIKLLPQKKNIGGKSNPYFVEIAMPYVTVAGRLKMMADEHIAAQCKYEIKAAQFILAPDTKTLLCRIEVDSLRGAVAAHAKVGINGGGVDATNPYENAETSAIGRALGFLGYGVLGTGIASYEEVTAAVAEKPQQFTSTASENKSNGIDNPLKIKIKEALIKRGISEIEAISRINALQTKDEAMAFLIELGKAITQPKPPDEQIKPETPTVKPEPPVENEASAPKPKTPTDEKPKQEAPVSDTKERVKTRELIGFKNLLVKKIGEQEARKVLPRIKYQSDLESARKEFGI